MSNQWFKFYGGDYLSDPKIGRLSPAERSCWLTLLCTASMTPNGDIEFLDVNDLLTKSGIRMNPYQEGDWEDCQNILIKLSSLKMIEVDAERSYITLTNWEKRQERALTVAERVAKYREKKKCNENVTTDVTNVTTEENRIEEKRRDNNIKTPAKRSATKKSKLLSGYEDSFEVFWVYYPNKTAKGKAYEVWQLLDDNLKKICTAAIRLQVESNHFWKDWINDGAGGDNAPHPTTWLNQRRWEDTVSPVPRVGKVKLQASKTLDLTK